MNKRAGTAVFVFLMFCVAVAAQQNSDRSLQVDEAGLQLHLLPHPELDLPLINTSGHPLEANLRIELTSLNGEGIYDMTAKVRAEPGSGIEKVAVELQRLKQYSPARLSWYLLSYTLTPRAGAVFAPVHGTVQAGEVIRDSFELRLSGPGSAAFGGRYPVTAWIYDPGTGKPLAGVPVKFELSQRKYEPAEKYEPVVHEAITDAQGYAKTVFDLSPSTLYSGGYVQARADIGDFSESQSINYGLESAPRLTLTTDKPIYQPEQKLHMRALARDRNQRARSGVKVTFRISDRNGAEQFRTTVAASKFGAAAADWEIPQKAALGDYSVDAFIESPSRSPNSQEGTAAHAMVRVSRYDLPQFVVETAPDRTFYLPGQDAAVEVRARYLTGKAVPQAAVRLEGETAAEGELDQTGRFVAHIPLGKSFEWMKSQKEQRFRDNSYTAYVTDASTGRSEQRRFTLRLSLQPVHLYLLSATAGPYSWWREWSYQLADIGPNHMYVTSAYADGSPASVEGTIEAEYPSAPGKFFEGPEHRTRLASFHTNRYGVARVEMPRLGDDLLTPEPRVRDQNSSSDPLDCVTMKGLKKDQDIKPARRALLVLQAIDSGGRKGSHEEQIRLPAEGDYLRISAEHALYHAGEPIQGSVLSTVPMADVVIGAYDADGIVSSQTVPLRNGEAAFRIPYESRMRGRVELWAVAVRPGAKTGAALSGQAVVVYPARRELQVGLQLKRTTFAPGEPVSAQLSVRGPDGKGAESELGILVVDRAVEERVRTLGNSLEMQNNRGFSIQDYLGPAYTAAVAGVSYRDLLNLDPARPFPEGLDLVAEALLQTTFAGERPWTYWRLPQVVHSGFRDGWMDAAAWRPSTIWGIPRNDGADALRNVAYAFAESTGKYPFTEAELAAALAMFGLDPESALDPWGKKYHPVFFVEGVRNVLRLVSDGPDKRPDTDDDLIGEEVRWPYFRAIGLAIDAATEEYHRRTGGFIRDYATLNAELKTRNIDLDTLRDPWGNSYALTFEVVGPSYVIHVDSPGPNGKFEEKKNGDDPYSDDVHLWTSSLRYFQQDLDALNRALTGHFERTGGFPQNQQELTPILEKAGLLPDGLIDPWGHHYYFSFSKGTEYGNETNPQPGPAGTMNQVTPMTRNMIFLSVSSSGPTPNRGFTLATFSKAISVQSGQDQKPLPALKSPPRLNPDTWGSNPGRAGQSSVVVTTFEESGGRVQSDLRNGGVAGTVSNSTGMALPGTVVSALAETGRRYSAITGRDGSYLLANLPRGTYRLEFTAIPFERRAVTEVPVGPESVALVNVQLKGGSCRMGGLIFGQNAGSVALAVTSTAAVVDTGEAGGRNGETRQEKQLFTPRVRQYFPETLLWQPDLVTDPQGHAHISFPMADSLSAWTMSVVASNENGDVGVAEQELQSFLPFFIEHDPPRVLTEGDRISLPVVLRNYSGRRQSVEAELNPESWFAIESDPRQIVSLRPDRNTSATFTFRAASSVRHGRQRVTARNATTGDAVEREVRVHPDGEEIAFSAAKLLAGEDNSFDIQLPAEMIAGSNDTELRVYPNLTAHVLDAVEAMGKPPAGCTEPWVSKGYVSLLILEILRKAGQDNSNESNPRAALAGSARAWLQLVYRALAASQNKDGGYSGWWSGSRVAETAYILRFLRKAEDFIPVDQDVISRAGKFLVTHQLASGAWMSGSVWVDPPIEDPDLTSYVARALAVARSGSQRMRREELDKGFNQAMAWIERRINARSDAWLVANYGIAAATAGRRDYMDRARDFLGRLAHTEGAATYWNLEANMTPLESWGLPGRVETTALSVEALSLLQAGNADVGAAEQVRRGLQFLLGHKDARGSWYSAYVTQSVIEAIVAAMPAAPEQAGASRANVLVNGRQVAVLELPPANAVVGPVTVELAGLLNKGGNTVQVVREAGAGAMNVTALTSYYIPWGGPATGGEKSFLKGESRALLLKVLYDQSSPRPNQPVRCHVEAERIGFQGYGVMQAEIGLPPGADLDLESLTHAPAYEIQPDRVVFYIGAAPGGSKFDFQFRLRYPIEAWTAPSILYDYYNPESTATVRPVKFTVPAEGSFTAEAQRNVAAAKAKSKP